MKARIFFLALLSLNAIKCVFSFAGEEDEITSLPGLTFKLNYKQYSGFLDSIDGRHLHYWFVESEQNPEKDPLVLWMNGGPGCSSILGLLTEQGPLHVHSDGKTLYANQYSWNKFANVIFLEAPAGVGFSYKDDGNYQTDDDQVAKANYAALHSFFQKFPQFKSNDFYVTGESYGGIYVPTLSVQILRGSLDINFKGFATGNGYLDQKNLGNSIIFFGYYHGLFGRSIWTQLSESCCTNGVSRETCNFVYNNNVTCQNAVRKAGSMISLSGLNIYNLYEDCVNTKLVSANPMKIPLSREHLDKKLMMKSLNLNNANNLFKELLDSPPCVDTTGVSNWINQAQVRESLHIPKNVQAWTECSVQVEMGYKNIYKTMKPQVLELITSNTSITGLIYNGDVDMACNFLGDEWFVDELGVKMLKDYESWKYGDQVGGWKKTYERLTFVTIRGSGHMVPQDKPGPALKMFYKFINGKPLI